MELTLSFGMVALTLALLSIGATVGAFVRISALKEAAQGARKLAQAAHREASKGPAGDLQARLAALETRVQSLPDLWDQHEATVREMKEHADRQYSRARAARSAAERAAREQEDELEEDDDVRGDDEGPGRGQGVLALPGFLGGPPQARDEGRTVVPPHLDPFFLAGMKPFGG